MAGFTWAMVGLAGNIPTILLSRLLSGALFGIYQANAKVYNAEIAHPAVRGTLGAVIGNTFALGCLYTYTCGYLVQSWRTVAWLQIGMQSKTPDKSLNLPKSYISALVCRSSLPSPFCGAG